MMDPQVYSLIHDFGIAIVTALPPTLVGVALLRGQQHIRNENAVIKENTDGTLAALMARQTVRDTADAAARLADGDAAREKAMRLPEGP